MNLLDHRMIPVTNKGCCNLVRNHRMELLNMMNCMTTGHCNPSTHHIDQIDLH